MMSLNHALDEAFPATWSNDSARAWIPALDVIEKKDVYQVFAELPGVDPQHVDLSFEQNVLTIQGTKTAWLDAEKQAAVRVFAAERTTGTFERSIRLPEFVDGDHITAEFQNGLLTVTIPKAQAARARRIEIKGAPTKQLNTAA
jgi:HSP20 family protein